VGVKPRSTGHDITRGKGEETIERVHYVKMTQTLFVEIISLIQTPRKNHLMKEGPVVEQSTTPMNGSMEGLAEETEDCQPKVPQGAVFLQAQTGPSFLLTEGTGQVQNLPGEEKGVQEYTRSKKRKRPCPQGVCDPYMLRGRKERISCSHHWREPRNT
jgi:hypothetical protein